MPNLNVEMVLKLIDQLSAPLRGATGAVGDFGKAAADANRSAAQGAEDYQKRLDGLVASMSKLSQISMGFHEVQRTADALGKPLDDATQKAIEFEKRMESIARAGGRLDMKDKIGREVLAASKASSVPWQDLAKGERHLMELGGGEFLDRIAPVRQRLAKLIYASEAESESLYGLLERYMKLGHMSADKAMASLEINYAQGKKGAYELKHMAHSMPELIGAGMSLGMTGDQVATDLPAVLQIMRQLSGTAGRADTMMRQGLKHLTDPHDVKRIRDELGVDVPEVRRGAVARGEDPMLAIANAISDALTKAGAGQVDHASGQIVGGDPEKLGALAREYNFRAFLDAFTRMRDQLKDYTATPAEAARQAADDFASRAKTTAGALDRLAVAADQTAIRLGDTQLDTTKSRAGRKEAIYEATEKAANAAPGTTGAALTAWNVLTNAGSIIARAGEALISGALVWKGMQYLGAKYPTMGALGENVLGVGKGLVKAPWDIAKGFGEGAAGEYPPLGALGRGMVENAGKGLAAGIIGAIGQWAIDKGIDATGAGHNRHADEFSGLGVFGKIENLLGRLAETIVPPARAETMAGAGAGEPAKPQVDSSQIDQAKDKAVAAGTEIKAALDVTAAPKVDVSSIDAALAKVRELAGALAAIGAQARATAASISRGSGALHDGYESR